MILFCDTSALVKLYVEEDGSDLVMTQAEASEAVAVCRIAWVELMSAFARRAREVPADAAALDRARRRFKSDWPHCLTIELTQGVAELAGEYAEAFALRAYDSMQLAAVMTLHRETAGSLRFACFDSRLTKAAQVLDIALA